jgi:hypothetical protein
MADYFTPTVIQPSIPAADITPLERFVLGHIFTSEADGDALYFFSDTGPCELFGLPVEQIAIALGESTGIPSRLADDLAQRVRSLDRTAAYLEFDLSVTDWTFIFQDIVRRSRTLGHVTAVSAFTCSKMRADAFGGMAVLITADDIKGKSTADILEDWVAEMEDIPPPGAAA